MFFPAKTPRAALEPGLRVLRVSLNTPVVAIEGFGVGPARAGIGLWKSHDGSSELSIALRSQRTGQVLFFAPEDQLDRMGGAEVAFDAALSFGESMGFLFDDDEVEARGLAEAVAVWRELIAGAEAPAEPRVATGPVPRELAPAPPPRASSRPPQGESPARHAPPDPADFRRGPEALELDFDALELRRLGGEAREGFGDDELLLEELVPPAPPAPKPAPAETHSALLTKFRGRVAIDPDAVAGRVLDGVHAAADEPPAQELAIRLLSHF